MEEMLHWKGLVCMNDRRATRIDVAWGGYSFIDLTLLSNSCRDLYVGRLGGFHNR